MASGTYGLAVIWTGASHTEAAAKFVLALEEILPIAQVPLVEIVKWSAGVTLHVETSFTLYSRHTLDSLRQDAERSGAKLVELLRLPDDARSTFKEQYLRGSGAAAASHRSYSEAARAIREVLDALGPTPGAAAGSSPPPASSGSGVVAPPVSSGSGTHASSGSGARPVPAPPGPAAGSRESRRDPRYNVLLETEFKTARDFVSEHATNISRGGMFIKTTQKLVLNSEIGLRVKLPSGEVLETTGRVVHLAEGGAGLTLAGDASFQESLERYLHSLAR